MTLPTSKTNLVLGAMVLSALLPPLFGADKIDLERLVPVAPGQPIPVQDFFRPPQFANPKLNSTGTFFAASVDLGDLTALMVCNLADKKIETLRGGSNKDLYAVDWLDDKRLLTSWTADKLYADGLFVNEAEKPANNYQIESKSATILVGVPRKTPMKPLIWIVRNAYDEGEDLGVVRLDATKPLGRDRDARNAFQARRNQDETELFGTRASIISSFPAPSGGLVMGYLSDKDGELAFAITAEKGVFTLFRFEKQKWVKSPVDLDHVDIIDAGDRPNELIVLGPGEAGKPRPLQRVDAVTGELGEVILQDKAYTPVDCSLYRDPATGVVIGVRFLRSRGVSAWFGEGEKTVQATLEAKFPGMIVRILGSDETENRFFFVTYSDRQPGSYYTLDVKTHTIAAIRESCPWIDPARMQPMNMMRFKTRDGHQLEAYVTLPAGASKQHPAPLVVLPHGGPWARDFWGFDAEAQFLASRGYAVLQPNYRGSTGYDWMFPTSDLWAFRKMHDDVCDAVKTLLSTGFVDSSRMAIMGTSFGGYLAACGAAFEPGMYRCAISISGVFDWAQVMREARYDQFTTAKYGILLRNLGDPKTHADEFAAISPLQHADQIKIPMFVAHGKEDETAEVTESRALIAQLVKYHVPHETMIKSGEGHGMAYLKNQVELYSRIEAFLAQNLAPKSAPAATAGTH